MKKFLLIVMVILLSSCTNKKNEQSFVIATTTSFVNTGVLDYLVDEYNKETGISIDYLPVGSGKAIELGKADEADILILHTNESVENALVTDGYTSNRIPFIENKFLIVSSNEDIWNNTFVSRGDNSGTHIRELEMWEEIDKPKDYIETGRGMLDTLIMTNELEGTTLIDKGTWLANKDKTQLLQVYNIDDKYARNVYSIHTVVSNNIEKERIAKDFSIWMTSDEVVTKIEQYKLDEYGESLFYRYKK